MTDKLLHPGLGGAKVTLTLNYPCGCQAAGKDIPLYCPTHGLSPEHRKYAHELAEAVVIQWLKRPLDGKEDSHQGLLWIRAAIEKFGERVLLSLSSPIEPALDLERLRAALQNLEWSDGGQCAYCLAHAKETGKHFGGCIIAEALGVPMEGAS